MSFDPIFPEDFDVIFNEALHRPSGSSVIFSPESDWVIGFREGASMQPNYRREDIIDVAIILRRKLLIE